MWFRGASKEIIALLKTLHANQLIMLRQLGELTNKVASMPLDITDLTAQVATNTSVTQSIVTLVRNLAAQIAAIPQSDDSETQTALDHLASTLKNNDLIIANAVLANTPVPSQGPPLPTPPAAPPPDHPPPAPEEPATTTAPADPNAPPQS